MNVYSLFMIQDASKELTLDSPRYLKAVEHFVWGAYQMDIGAGDLTARDFASSAIVTARVVAKESGILAGILEAQWFLKKIGLRPVLLMKDGDTVKKKDILIEFKGPASKILSAERTLLNLLQRMSGIATATHRLVSLAPKHVKILATRKTFWGDLDKRAVAVGGGATHRLNLCDAVLVKENHLALADDFQRALRKFFKLKNKGRFAEMELETPAQAELFLKAYLLFKKPKSVVVMLDNFSPVQVKKCAPKLAKAGILVEVSGGIQASNLKAYALPGVSAISSGAITNKAPALNFSLDLLK